MNASNSVVQNVAAVVSSPQLSKGKQPQVEEEGSIRSLPTIQPSPGLMDAAPPFLIDVAFQGVEIRITNESWDKLSAVFPQGSVDASPLAANASQVRKLCSCYLEGDD
ncbi:uncharacterized protein A4U43_C08F7600 [Asparagus officinalis]|nr:uncharacterized protein A4U43_C08F7600 [Asparagus officinalis]